MFGFFKNKIENLKQAVSNTAQSLVGNVLSNVESTDTEYSEFALDDIEDTLISADLGVNYAAELVDNLRNKKNAKPSELKNYLKEEFKKTLSAAGSTELNYKDNELNLLHCRCKWCRKNNPHCKNDLPIQTRGEKSFDCSRRYF